MIPFARMVPAINIQKNGKFYIGRIGILEFFFCAHENLSSKPIHLCAADLKIKPQLWERNSC